MKIQIIEKEETKYSSKIISNRIAKDQIDLNTVFESEDIENIKIVVIRSSKELKNRDKRFIQACGGYDPQTRMIRYFLLFFSITFISLLSILIFTNDVFPKHIYEGNIGLNLFILFIFSALCGVIGLLIDAIFMMFRLARFSYNEKKRSIK